MKIIAILHLIVVFSLSSNCQIFDSKINLDFDNGDSLSISFDDIKKLSNQDLISEINGSLFHYRVIELNKTIDTYVKHLFANVFMEYSFETYDNNHGKYNENRQYFSLAIYDHYENATIMSGSNTTLLPLESGCFMVHKEQQFTKIEDIVISEVMDDFQGMAWNACDVVNDGEFYGVKDSSNEFWLIAPEYDSIQVVNYQYFKCFKNSIESIYNRFCEVVDLETYNVRDYHMVGTDIQVILGNEMKYINKEGDLVDTLRTYPYSRCGYGLMGYRKIVQKGNWFYLETHRNDMGSLYKRDTIHHEAIESNFRVSTKVIGKFNGDLTFVNNGKYADEQTDTGFLIISGNRKGILENTLSDDYKSWSYNLIWENEADDLTYDAENRMFIFKNKGLFGHVLISDKAKYLELDPFVNFYSRFKLPNGQRGWVNKEGSEFFDK